MTSSGEDILDSSEAGPAAIQGGVLRVAGYVVGTLLSVGSAAALLRYLGLSDFGRYATVLALVTIVAGLTEAGMTSVGVREWAVRGRLDRLVVLRNLLGLRLALTSAGIVLATGFAAAVGYAPVLVWGTALWGLGTVVQMAAVTLGIPLQADLRFGWVSVLDLVRQATTVVFILALIVAGAPLLALLAVPLPAALVTLGATVVVVRGSGVPLLPALDWSRWRELAAVTLPYAAASAVGAIYVFVSQILMSLFTSEEATGIFGASFRIFIVLVTIPALMVTAALPILARSARDDAERLRYAVSRLYVVGLTVGALMAVVVAAAAPVAIEIVAGAGYERSIDVLRIHGLALMLSFLAAAGGYALLSTGRHSALLVANAAALVTSATLTIWLGRSIGAQGAALANVAGEAVLTVGYGIGLRRSGLRSEARAWTRVLAAAAGAAAPILFLPSLAATFAGVALFVAILALLGGIPAEGAEMVRRLRSARC